MSTGVWTFEELDVIYKSYNTDGAEKVAERLGRSISTVHNKADKLGLLPQGEFKKYELDLASTYGKTLGSAMIFLLPRRTTNEVVELIRCKHDYSPS